MNINRMDTHEEEKKKYLDNKHTQQMEWNSENLMHICNEYIIILFPLIVHQYKITDFEKMIAHLYSSIAV